MNGRTHTSPCRSFACKEEVEMAGGDAELLLVRPGDKEVWEDLQHKLRNAVEVQKRLLEEILEKNGNTEYLRQRTQLNGSTDKASFKACVPLITYQDIEADVQRIADGDKSPILCADPVLNLTLSSGTSGGKAKMLPTTAKSLSFPLLMIKRFDLARNMAFPLKPGSRSLSFSYAGKVFVTKGGLKAGAGTSIAFRSDMFKNRDRSVVQNAPAWVSPDEVMLGHSIPESMYCHLLCGLKRYQEIESLDSIFAYGLAEGFRCLEQAWRELVDDLRTGTVSAKRVVDQDVRVAVEKLLGGPDVEAAGRVEEECGKGVWEGVVHRLWPRAKFVKCILTGAMAPYVPVLQRYLGPDLPLLSGDYGASEGWVGSNLDPKNPPEDSVFTLVPDVVYLEFVPLYRLDEQHGGEEEEVHVASTAVYSEGPPVGIADVKVGQIYELVFTNFAGLYRYRMSDVVKVVGFYHQAPKVSFVCRKNVVLSVNTDKTDEAELMAVVAKAARLLADADNELVDFTSQADITSRPGSYVIYWELKSSTNLNPDVLQRCCTLLDQSFNNPYMRGRVANTIGPLKLRVVKEGSFRKLADFALGVGGGASQYKTPRCVASPKVLAILDAQLVQEFQSPDFPATLLAAWKPLPDSA